MTRTLKIFWVVLATPVLMGFMGSNAVLMASHATHFVSDKGPKLPQDETGCVICHAPGHLQCGEDAPLFGDGEDPLPLASTDVCDNCHSPGGAFDGVNDPVIGAKANWESGVYDGDNLAAGKEQWCATCHDDEPAYSNQNAEFLVGSTLVDDTDPEECSFNPDDWHQINGRNAYGGTFLWISPDDDYPDKTVTWTPNISISGRYDIFMWNPYNGSRGNVTYTVHHTSGSTDVSVDQSVAQKVWLFIGNFEFDAGTSGSVVLSDLGDGTYINGDAMRFVLFGGGARAPSVAGDNSTYGFYVTGHGRDKPVDCLSCHDAQVTHIDGEHRTYDLEGTTVLHPYNAGYRLPEKSMVMPRPVGTTLWSDTRNFALCFRCHNYNELLGEDFLGSDYSHTNFWDSEPTSVWARNAHQYHIRNGANSFDSNYDETRDSKTSCVTCHNVHGPPNPAMIRHGELISTPGTTDKVPAINFSYREPRTENIATATFTSSSLSVGGDYNVYAWWTSHADYANHAGYTVYHDGAESPSEVVKQHNANGGQWNLLGTYHYDAGSTGTVVLDNDYAWGGWLIADAVMWEEVANPANAVIVDNADVGTTFVNDQHTWEVYDVDAGSGPQDLWGTNLHRINNHWLTLPDTTNPTLATSAGGWSEHGDEYWTTEGTGVCSCCHIPHHALYIRAPKLWPKVITMPGAEPSEVVNDGTGTSLVTVLISDPDDNATSVTIDLTPFGGSATQAMNDNGDGTYSYLVTVPTGLMDGEKVLLEVTATDADTNTGTGKIWITPIIAGAVYVDDLDAAFTPDCPESCTPLVEWTPSTSFPDQQLNGRFKVKGINEEGSGTATWTPNVPTSGVYEVSAWWVHGNANLASENAPYTIYYDGGSQRVEVDQTVNGPGGGKWNVLGTYPFAAGTSGHIVLSDDATPAPVPGANTYIQADGIRLVPQP